jgi:hypothetical protein
MTCESNPTLSQYEPVVGALMAVEYAESGWRLVVRHRHCTGRFGDCGEDQFDHLSLGELEDVLCAVVSVWGPWGDATRPLDERSF